MRVLTFLVDAFTAVPYAGNPAAVCLIPFPKASSPVSDAELQRIAYELNFSETVFVFLPRFEDEDAAAASMRAFANEQLDQRGMRHSSLNGGGSADPQIQCLQQRARRSNQRSFGIRWFSPQREIGLCGHATLSAAHVLFETLPSSIDYSRPQPNELLQFVLPRHIDTVIFVSSMSGVLPVSRAGASTTVSLSAASRAAGLLPPLPPAAAAASSFPSSAATGAAQQQQQQFASGAADSPAEATNLGSDNEGVSVVPASVFNSVVAAAGSTTASNAQPAASPEAVVGPALPAVGSQVDAALPIELARARQHALHQRDDATPGMYDLNFPARMPLPVTVLPSAQLTSEHRGDETHAVSRERLELLTEALGIQPDAVAELRLHAGSGKYLVVCKSIAAIVGAQVDTAKLLRAFDTTPAEAHLGPLRVAPLSVTITAPVKPSDREAAAAAAQHGQQQQLPPPPQGRRRLSADILSECDCVSRHFAPWVGINEDPVTGAAHVMLGPYWCQQLGRRGVQGYQASARGGFIFCRLLEGTGDTRVLLTGSAVTVMEGSMVVSLERPVEPSWIGHAVGVSDKQNAGAAGGPTRGGPPPLASKL